MKRISQVFSTPLVRAALLPLLFASAAIALVQSEGTPPPFPPPGKLVDVGGWRPLGDMPLIVLTRGKVEEEGPQGKALEEEHRRDHAAVAAMSHKGKLVIAARSGHHVQLDEPELVIKSIREVLEAVRK